MSKDEERIGGHYSSAGYLFCLTFKKFYRPWDRNETIDWKDASKSWKAQVVEESEELIRRYHGDY